MGTDIERAIGEEETSHARDAESSAGMERGLFAHYLARTSANAIQRGHGRGWKKWPK